MKPGGQIGEIPREAAAQFSDVERRLSLYLRALWGRSIRLRPLTARDSVPASRRATLDGTVIRLPLTLDAASRDAGLALYRAACAHAAAHVVFTTRRFSAGEFTPLQIAMVSVIEDARVEQCAIRELGGLHRIWMPHHGVRPGSSDKVASLLARLARALIDEDYEDDDPWVSKGRRLFFGQRERWGDQSFSEELGSLLGKELGKRHGRFDFKSHVVEPAYRDDHVGIWNFGHAGMPGEEHEFVSHARRPAGGDDIAEDNTSDVSNATGQGTDGSAVQSDTNDSNAQEQVLSAPVHYDEWDYLIGRERPAWCTLQEKSAATGDSHTIAETLERNDDLVNRVKYLVRAVQVQRPVRLKRRIEGDRLDLDACVSATVDLRAGLPPDPRVHAALGRRQRDLSVLVLLDLSQSTNDIVAGAGTTVLELAREATVLLADAMDRIGDHFAIHGFSSNGRHDVGYYRFKDFDLPYDEAAKSRLAGMTSQLSTRMGTALRHAGSYLKAQRAHKKLVLLITDGEPSDIDVHDAQYLVLDAKKAVEENQRHGIYAYCMSLDLKADRYVSRIFGVRNWTVMDHINRLPERLPLLYMRLTH